MMAGAEKAVGERETDAPDPPVITVKGARIARSEAMCMTSQ
jgi:hypothetical protein